MSKVQVTTHVFGPRFSETVLNELDPRYSRAEVTLTATAAPLAFGTVLARDADGKYAPLKETGGTLGDAAAILLADVPASDAEQQALVLRGYCIVNGSRLVFDESVTKKSEALQALQDRGFVVKEVPADGAA